MSKIAGIYLITNLIENKYYVGRSNNCKVRFSKHKSLLRKNKHHNPYLQNSWNKNNEENFIFEIIDENDIEILPSLENWWCNVLNTHNKLHGYNIDLTGPNGKIKTSEETINKIRIANTGKIVSEETKELLRIANTGKKQIEEVINKLRNNKRNQSVDVYDNFGNFIKTYKSIRECSRELNIDNKGIGRCISGEFNLFESKIFKNHGDLLSKKEIKLRNNNSHDNLKKKVIGYNLDGSLIGEFSSSYQAEKITGFNAYRISLCCKGKQKKLKNTIWKYID